MLVTLDMGREGPREWNERKCQLKKKEKYYSAGMRNSA